MNTLLQALHPSRPWLKLGQLATIIIIVPLVQFLQVKAFWRPEAVAL